MSRRRTIFFICLLLTLSIGGMAWRLFRREPAIVVSRETTYITEPLGEDGLPDYVEFLRRESQRGVRRRTTRQS
ncbi:MAG: hypothetical protein R3C10_00545 [Pirellulales bacterium]